MGTCRGRPILGRHRSHRAPLKNRCGPVPRAAIDAGDAPAAVRGGPLPAGARPADPPRCPAMDPADDPRETGRCRRPMGCNRRGRGRCIAVPTVPRDVWRGLGRGARGGGRRGRPCLCYAALWPWGHRAALWAHGAPRGTAQDPPACTGRVPVRRGHRPPAHGELHSPPVPMAGPFLLPQL